jgi:hypothetical protein
LAAGAPALPLVHAALAIIERQAAESRTILEKFILWRLINFSCKLTKYY